jgi:hypothetical protein
VRCSRCSGAALARRGEDGVAARVIALGAVPAGTVAAEPVEAAKPAASATSKWSGWKIQGAAATTLAIALLASRIFSGNAPTPPVETEHSVAAEARAQNTDTIHATAAAPAPDPAAAPAQLVATPGLDPIPGLHARPTRPTVELRTGPGAEFPVIGLADIKLAYPVVRWKNRWFEVTLASANGTQGAWVHGSAIELISPTAPPAANPPATAPAVGAHP